MMEITKMDKVITANDQQNVIVQTPTAAELNAVAEIPESEGSSRSIGKVVPVEEALTKNLVDLSKNKKLRIAHQGFKEIAISIKGEPTWGIKEITLDDGTKVKAWAYIEPETRPLNKPYATTVDDHVLEEPGTFSKISGYQYDFDGKKLGYFESIKYDQNAISVEGSGNGLIQPVPALAADEELVREIDTTYRKGQNLFTPIDKENYLSRAGLEVKTSETYLAQATDQTTDESTDEATDQEADKAND